jgi:hypothetical protein
LFYLNPSSEGNGKQPVYFVRRIDGIAGNGAASLDWKGEPM